MEVWVHHKEGSVRDILGTEKPQYIGSETTRAESWKRQIPLSDQYVVG